MSTSSSQAITILSIHVVLSVIKALYTSVHTYNPCNNRTVALLQACTWESERGAHFIE